MIENKPEFLRQGAVPFALPGCEKLTAEPVTGFYDPKAQRWVGDGVSFAATRTVTATTLGQDQDID